MLALSALLYAAWAGAPAVLWQRAYDFAPSESHPHAGVQTSDGGFFIVGDGLDFTNRNPKIKRYVYVLKTDANGVEQWRLTLAEMGWNYGKFGLQMPDGSYIISGSITTLVNGAEVQVRGLVRISAQGAVVGQPWLMPPGPPGRMEGFTGFALAEDGNLVATGFVQAWPGCDDQAMFLVYGSVGVTKLRPNPDGSFTTIWDRVLAPPASANYKQAAEGMRVLYDASARQYVVSHTVIIDLAGGQFEFGLSAFDQDSGDLKWTHGFPAASNGYTGTASHPYALAMGRGAQGGAVYAIGGLAVPSDEAVNDPVGRLLTVSPDGAVVFDKRFQLKPTYNIECYGVQPTRDNGWILSCGYGVKSNVEHPNATQDDLTWQALLYRTDPNGEPVWNAAYGDQSTHLSNAGEFVVATSDGGYAMYVDSKGWGNAQLGGSFALLRLAPEAQDVVLV